MRLQLVVFSLLLALSAKAGADGRAATWLEVYDDDDGLNVISSQVSLRGEATEGVELSASHEVDIISSATADVVSAASPRGYEERRHGLSFGAQWEVEAGTILSIRLLPSWEVDYRSKAAMLGFSREWIDRRLTTSITSRLSLDQVGRSGSGEHAFKDLNTVAVAFGLGWIISRYTLVQAKYEPQRSSGYLSNPYRFVDILWDDGKLVSAAEVVPNTRLRHAMAIGIRHALTEEWFLSGNYRFYTDTWGMTSHTGEVELQHALGWDDIILGLNLRAYRQSAANFQKATYEAMSGTLPTFRTSDKMLAESWSMLGGVRAEYSLGKLGFLKGLRLALKLEAYRQRFNDIPTITERFAKTAALGASSEF